MRRSVWPLREVIGALQRGESELIGQGTLIYLRDVCEHTIQVIDTMEIYRDIVSGLLDIYLSGLSNKLNEVMKVLTVILTILIPITFVTSLYGMNFVYMPNCSGVGVMGGVGSRPVNGRFHDLLFSSQEMVVIDLKGIC